MFTGRIAVESDFFTVRRVWPKDRQNQRPEHVLTVDPAKTWQLGLLGFLTRYRGLASTAAAKIVATGMAFWLVNLSLAIHVLGFGVCVLVVLWILRTNFLKRIRQDERLHAITHEFRDEISGLLDSPATSLDRSQKLGHLLTEFVNQVAAYYRYQFDDDTSRCALRLLDQSGKNYVTEARSTGFEKGRKRNSEPIPIDKGLAKALREKDAQGVFLVPSIETAITEQIWHPTNTDGLPDVKHLMVAPVNILDRDQRQMIGILYLTSLDRKFSGPDTLAFKAYADYLGMVLMVIGRHEPSKKDGAISK